jgi:hypothetical protein
VFDAARARRLSEASLECGWRGMVLMLDVVEAILDIEGRADRALIFFFPLALLPSSSLVFTICARIGPDVELGGPESWLLRESRREFFPLIWLVMEERELLAARLRHPFAADFGPPAESGSLSEVAAFSPLRHRDYSTSTAREGAIGHVVLQA